ncbi:MAG: phosphoribosylamine--glycine ligase [Thermomicrobiales bacterium]|nr:phosphoribosylamine--glycine ligase [Thermomicrobiales bacterium]
MGDRVIVVGSGAREHALAWSLSRSPLVDSVVSAPGNPGTERFGRNAPVDVLDIEGLTQLALDTRADLVMVGPEAPLAAGLADALRARDLLVCGPSQAAARIESSKSWAKEIMNQAGVPTARATVAASLDDISDALAAHVAPVVIKADGLAAGKGVVIAETLDRAAQVCREMLDGTLLGSTAGSVLIEEFLTGQEVSLLALTDGNHLISLLPACDYKRAHDQDEGPNTGGMGAYAPVPGIDSNAIAAIEQTILRPSIDAMAASGALMNGVLYAGLMMTSDGPKVLEFNARFGDPETQVILPLLESDLYPLLRATAAGDLASQPPLRWSNHKAVGVVMASGGYPGSYRTEHPIDDQGPLPGTEVFFAGVKRGQDGSLLTGGGRVLTAVGVGDTWEAATERAYARAGCITFQDGFHRTDIARRTLASG